MASGPTFESDLRAVREAHGLSLTEIHQQTRIPVDVLRRFEDGDLVQDSTYNEVYLKAFIQSYAKAIGVPASAALVGYEDQKAGAYRGALHPDGAGSHEAPATPAASPEPPREASAAPPAEARPPAEPTPKPAARKPPPPAAKAPEADRPPAPKRAASDAPPAVAALRQTPDPEKKKAAEAPKTLAEARVGRPAVPGADRSFDKNWTTILGLFVVVLVLMAGALYFLVFADDDVPEPETDATVAVGAAGPAGETVGPPQREVQGPEFQLPIRVALVAGGDGLQSFRVTEDDEARRPYWVEPGDTLTVTGEREVILWGEDPTGDFSEATVLLQGLRFTPRNGRELAINAQTGQALLDSLAGPQAPTTPTP